MILTNSQIDLCCKDVVFNASLQDILLFDLYTNYLNTGLRARELLEYHRWSISFDNKFICETEKGSNNRTFDLIELTPRFISLMLEGEEPYKYNSFSTVNLYFQRFLPYAYCKVKTKNLGLCLFRHNKIKQMKDSGLSFVDIQNYFGEVEINNILGYYNSEILVPN